MVLKARTYSVVADGTCPLCDNGRVPLRFVWQPDPSPDLICCEDCAKRILDYYEEAANTP